MNSSNAFRINWQIITAIIVIAVVISVVDNIVDSQRFEEASEEGALDREMLFNETRLQQRELEATQQRHISTTETASRAAIKALENQQEEINEIRQIFEKLTKGVNRQEEIVAKLDQIINQTTTNSSNTTTTTRQ